MQATARPGALNTGTALLALGVPTGTCVLTIAGDDLAMAALGASLALELALLAGEAGLALAAGALGDIRQLPATANR